MGWASPTPRSIVKTQASLLLKARSEYLVTQQQESVLMSMAHITISDIRILDQTPAMDRVTLVPLFFLFVRGRAMAVLGSS